jgi:hypothetical protein
VANIGDVAIPTSFINLAKLRPAITKKERVQGIGIPIVPWVNPK